MFGFKRFLGFLKPYPIRTLTAILLVLAVSCLTLTYPVILKHFLDDALPKKDWALAQKLLVLFTIFFLARGLLSYISRYLLQHIGMRVCVDMRKTMFAHLQSLSMKYYEGQQTGQLVARVAEDTGALHSLVTSVLANAISDSATILVVVGMMFSIDWKLALLTLAVLPLFVFNYKFHLRHAAVLSRIHRRNWFRVLGFLHERVSNARLVKSFAMEEKEIDRFNTGVEQDLTNFNRLTLFNARLWVFADMISSLGGLLVLSYGGWLAIHDRMTLGSLVQFNTLIGFLFSPLVRISDVNAIIERAFVALQKIYQVLDTPSFVAESPAARDLPPVAGRVEFKDVEFSFNAGRTVLHQIDLVAEPGQLIALVGRSGAGKTTLINLLCRFYDVDSGSIRIDGVDIRDVTIKSLRRQIAVVMQENTLFGGTLQDNIRYGNPEAGSAEIEAAARAAHAHEFIEKLPTGYLSRVGERGVKLSGGQRQRIAIARALLTNPRILIFDEATSALDSESERLIQEAMEKFTAGRTTFVIAHRLSTILKADMIVVLEDGQIVERGRHADLLQSQGPYRKLYDLQFRDHDTPASGSSIPIGHLKI